MYLGSMSLANICSSCLPMLTPLNYCTTYLLGLHPPLVLLLPPVIAGADRRRRLGRRHRPRGRRLLPLGQAAVLAPRAVGVGQAAVAAERGAALRSIKCVSCETYVIIYWPAPSRRFPPCWCTPPPFCSSRGGRSRRRRSRGASATCGRRSGRHSTSIPEGGRVNAISTEKKRLGRPLG